MISQYFAPTKVIFGKGAEGEAGNQLSQFGTSNVLMVYGGHSAEKSGLLNKVRDDLKEHGIRFIELGGVQPNPRISLARKGVELCKENGLDFILAIGGGSVIDTAKAIGYGLYNGGDPWDFYCGKRTPAGSAPVGVILTMAAAGSEMSDSSVLTNEDGGLKRGCNSDYCRVKFALMNPELTYTVPPYQTSCGTADIMMHTMERYFHAGKTLELSDNLSIALLKTVAENGVKALSNPKDYEARKNLMWASSLSHNGLMQMGNDQRGDWSCHQIEHELSGMYDVAHGAGLTAIWASWARYVYTKDPERFAKLGAGVFGIKRTASPERDAEEAIKAFENYFASIHMPTSLKELGINPSDKEIDELAEKATFFGKRTIGAFMTLGKDAIKAIYAAARK